MAITVTANLTTISMCEDATGWNGGNQTSDEQIQGTYCLGDAASATTSTLRTYNFGSGQDMSDQTIYAWVKVNGQVDTQANGGYRLYAQDTSGNYSYWYAGGNDTHQPGWKCIACSVEATRDSGSGTLNTASIQYVGVQFKTLTQTRTQGKTVVDNIFWDAFRYGTGLTITSGASDGIGCAEVFAEDDNSSNKYGVIQKSLETGAFMIQGKLIFGDASGTGSVDFDDTGVSAYFVKSDYFASDFNAIEVVGNGTGTTNFVMGDTYGGQGVDGCIVKSVGTPKYTITATDTDIDVLKFYGCVFLDAGDISLPPNASGREVLTCTFSGCGELIADTCVVQYCTFTSPTDRAIRMSSTSHNITDCIFINAPDGVNISLAGDNSFDFDNLLFYNCTYDIEFSGSSGDIIVNNLNGANASTYEITGAGSSVTINTAVTIAVHVEDTGGTDIQHAQVYVQKSPATAYTSDTGNNAGDADLVVNETVDTDTPQTGWLIVNDVSANEIMPYRYASWATKTFTFPTEETGSCSSTGTGTQLLDTGSDFGGTTDVEEGDTIRNTTDSSWAVVDEIVSSSELTTTQLQGGSDNTWQSSDGWSVHKLAVTLVDNDDTVDIPLVNDQTDATGDVSKTYNYTSTQAINVRIRSSSGATKYINYQTTGNIGALGYTLTAVMQEDEVAT